MERDFFPNVFSTTTWRIKKRAYVIVSSRMLKMAKLDHEALPNSGMMHLASELPSGVSKRGLGTICS